MSALVLNLNDGRKTVECVRGLLDQTISDRLEVIVIDNGSEDDSLAEMRRCLVADRRVRIIANGENGGFGFGYNRGAQEASGKYLFFNNPDKRLLNRSGLERLVARLEGNPRLGALGPRLVHPDGSVRRSFRRFPTPLDILAKRTPLGLALQGRLRRYLMLDVEANRPHAVDWVVGGCLFITRTVFEEVGGFDERFFLFFEDTDLCRRIQALGRGVGYEATVSARDKKERLSALPPWKMLATRVGRAHIVSGVKYFWKWRARSRRPAA